MAKLNKSSVFVFSVRAHSLFRCIEISFHIVSPLFVVVVAAATAVAVVVASIALVIIFAVDVVASVVAVVVISRRHHYYMTLTAWSDTEAIITQTL